MLAEAAAARSSSIRRPKLIAVLGQTPKYLPSAVLSALANFPSPAKSGNQPSLAEIAQRFPDSATRPPALNISRLIIGTATTMPSAEYLNACATLPASPCRFSEFASRASTIAGSRTNASLQSLAKKPGDGQPREDAAWRAAWIYYLKKDDKNAHAAFKRLASDKDRMRWRTAALYWQARTAARMDQNEEAKQLFLAVLRDPEDTYYKVAAAAGYSALAHRRREESGLSPGRDVKPTSSRLRKRFIFPGPGVSAGVQALAVATDEVKALGPEDLSLRCCSCASTRQRRYSRSVALAYQLQFPRSSISCAIPHPLAYGQVQTREETASIRPIVSLIRQESLFDPRRFSPAALGLMQLLHSTATRTAARMSLPPPPRERLFEPEVNLTLGIHHLKELLQKYSNSLIKAIAAYNAGENAVSRWEARLAGVDDDEFIERIPYPETQLYVKLVLRNLRIYRNLYGEPK